MAPEFNNSNFLLFAAAVSTTRQEGTCWPARTWLENVRYRRVPYCTGRPAAAGLPRRIRICTVMYPQKKGTKKTIRTERVKKSGKNERARIRVSGELGIRR